MQDFAVSPTTITLIEVAVPELLHDTVTCPLPAATVSPAGSTGRMPGVAVFEMSESGPVPNAFEACTVKEYWFPFVSPVTEQERAPVVSQWMAELCSALTA